MSPILRTLTLRLAAGAGLLVAAALGCADTKAGSSMPASGSGGGSALNGGTGTLAGSGGKTGGGSDGSDGGTQQAVGGEANPGGEAGATGVPPAETHFGLAAPRFVADRWGKAVLADFDGDAKLDVAAGAVEIGIFINRGSRELALTKNYSPGSTNRVSWLEAGDLNGDGLADLAASYLLDDTMISDRATVVMLNSGDGTFASARKVADGAVLAIADLNGDDRGDLIVADGLEGETVRVLLNDGTGSAFAASGSFAAESGSLRAAVADLNGDRALDFVVTTYNADAIYPVDDTGNVDVFLSQGGGAFEKSESYSLIKGASEAVVADFSGDGAPDILATEALHAGPDTAVNLFVNDGHGKFADIRNLPVGSSGGVSAALVSADFDADGRPDFAVPGGTSDQATALKIFKNLGNGSFAEPSYTPLPWVIQAASGDIDGDGRIDLLTTSLDDGISALFAYDDGTFPSTFGLTRAITTPSLLLGDVSGDAQPDIVLTSLPNVGSAGMRVYKNDGAGAFRSAFDYAAPRPRQAALVELNHDQKPDLVVAGLEVNVLMNQGTGFAAPVSYPSHLPYGTPERIVAGDLNADGEPDLVVFDLPFAGDSDPVSDPLSVLLNQGNGTFATPVSYMLKMPSRTVGTLALSDLNGDGALDVLVATGNTINIYTNDGRGALRAAPEYTTGSPAFSLGDIDGDQLPDLALAQPTPALALNDGHGTFEAAIVPSNLPEATQVSAVLLHDVDQDDELDLLWAGPQFLAVALGHGDATFDRPLLYATPSSAPALRIAAADLNADAKVDVCVQSAEGFAVLFNDGN